MTLAKLYSQTFRERNSGHLGRLRLWAGHNHKRTLWYASCFVDCQFFLRLSLVGEYTVVVSVFEPHHMGSFSLMVDSSYPFDLKPIPQEGAGMYSKVVHSSW